MPYTYTELDFQCVAKCVAVFAMSQVCHKTCCRVTGVIYKRVLGRKTWIANLVIVYHNCVTNETQNSETQNSKWNLKLKTWNSKLKVKLWNSKLKVNLKTQSETQNSETQNSKWNSKLWNLKLKTLKLKTWNSKWNSKLKNQSETQNSETWNSNLNI